MMRGALRLLLVGGLAAPLGGCLVLKKQHDELAVEVQKLRTQEWTRCQIKLILPCMDQISGALFARVLRPCTQINFVNRNRKRRQNTLCRQIIVHGKDGAQYFVALYNGVNRLL